MTNVNVDDELVFVHCIFITETFFCYQEYLYNAISHWSNDNILKEVYLR